MAGSLDVRDEFLPVHGGIIGNPIGAVKCMPMICHGMLSFGIPTLMRRSGSRRFVRLIRPGSAGPSLLPQRLWPKKKARRTLDSAPRRSRGLGYGICLNSRLCCPSLRVRPSLAFIRSMFYARFPNPFRVAEEESCRVSGSRLTAPFKPPGLNDAQLQAPTTVIFRAVSVPKPARPLGPLLLIRQPCGRMQTHRWHLLRSLRYVGAHSCCPLRSRTPSKPRRPQ